MDDKNSTFSSTPGSWIDPDCSACGGEGCYDYEADDLVCPAFRIARHPDGLTNPFPADTQEHEIWTKQEAEAQARKAAVTPVPMADPPSSNGHGSPDGSRTVRLTSAAGMLITRTRWLHGDERGGHVPLGMITLLAGREGTGKSTTSAWYIAKLTKGELPGEFHGQPKGVVVYATEDDWSSVILPRLVAAGADLNRVYKAEVVVEEDGDGWLSFPRDLEALAQQCTEHDVALVVIDPIMSVIDGKIDTHKDRDLRKVLEPLQRFAARRHVSVIGLIHFNKTRDNDVLNMVMAGKAFAAVARSVLACIKVPESDDDGEDTDQYMLCHPKCNVGPKQPSRKYTFTSVGLEASEDGSTPKIWTSKIQWGDTDSRTAQDLLDETHRTTKRPKGNLRGAILAFIGSMPAAVPVQEIYEEFSDRANETTIKMTLSRMVKAGEIERVFSGLYRKSSRSAE